MLCALSLSLLSAGVAGAAVTTFVDLTALPGGGAAYPYGAADGINNSGQVTGCMSIGGLYSAFLYTSGTVYDLSSQFGNTGTTVTHATGINGAGQMSGMWGVPGKTAYYYSGGSAGTATALVLPGGTTGNAASGQSIDAAGDVVGYATASDGTGDVAAFFYRNSTATMYELARPTGTGYMRPVQLRPHRQCDQPQRRLCGGLDHVWRLDRRSAGAAPTACRLLDLQHRWFGKHDLDRDRPPGGHLATRRFRGVGSQ